MSCPSWKKLRKLPRELTGFAEGTAILLTVGLFLVSYLARSMDLFSHLVMQGMFLIGATVLCGIVIYGVLVRHFIPFISHITVAGACMIGLSRVTAFMAELPAFSMFPLIGPASESYLVHHDDMLLYPGFILMLGGFYLSILHAAQMRKALVTGAVEKEAALARIEESANTLARRVAFENLATGISTRFINLGHDEIDGEINRALAELGSFCEVDRSYTTFFKAGSTAVDENFEWCAPEITPFCDANLDVSMEEFFWAIKKLRNGEIVLAQRLEDLPPEAAFERDWFASQGIMSVINVPVISNNSLRGYIGFDSVVREMTWSDETVPLLRMIGEILLSAWDRRCAEQQRSLLEYQVQQAQKLESLGVMAGGIAHDFNNLLTGIMGNTELAQLELPPESNSYRYLDGVTQSSRRAAELCRQMLAYAGKGKFVARPLDLNQLILDMMPLLRASASRRTEFDLQLTEGLPEVVGDVDQFRQILGNLVTNASESLEELPGVVTIRTEIQNGRAEFLKGSYLIEPLAWGQYVVLSVEDTGTGMTDAVKEKILEPFYSTRFAGRGLGLPAVFGIVRGHKGALRIESEVGVGTTIALFFPPGPVPQESVLVPGELQGDWHGHGTVLLADDEEMVLSVGSMMLRHLGLDVITASNGDDVLERARTHAASLQCVILDYEMPGTESATICTQLRAEFPRVPIVIASGHAKQDISSAFDAQEVEVFLSKPFELSGLKTLLHQLISPASQRD